MMSIGSFHGYQAQPDGQSRSAEADNAVQPGLNPIERLHSRHPIAVS